MKTEKLATLLLAMLVILSCSSNNGQTEPATKKAVNLSMVSENKAAQTESSMAVNYQKTIKLNHGFEVQVGGKEDFDNFSTYTLFQLTRKGIKIYKDSLLEEYEFGDKLYPMVLPAGRKYYQVLVEVNYRPSKNYLKLFRIDNDRLVNMLKLPTFISQAANLDDDATLEYAGYWDYNQTSKNENGDEFSSYNPILYYELTKEGIELDSTLTIQKNTDIYGKFHGYEFSEVIIIPASYLRRFTSEIKRIEATKE